MTQPEPARSGARMIDKLEFVILLAHEQSFGKAVEATSATPSTLAVTIQQLVEQQGVMPVERGRSSAMSVT